MFVKITKGNVIVTIPKQHVFIFMLPESPVTYLKNNSQKLCRKTFANFSNFKNYEEISIHFFWQVWWSSNTYRNFVRALGV